MSDPDRSGPYTCHGPMQPVTLADLTAGLHERLGPAVWICETCGVWKSAIPRSETALREIVDVHMLFYVQAMREGQQ